MARADEDIGLSEAARGSAALPTDLPDEFEPASEAARENPSLMGDIDALITDGKTYLEAEIAYQKSRAGFAANRLKWTVAYGAAAFGLIHLALIALTVGVVISLVPLVGPWIATAIVVVLLLLGATAFVLRLRSKLSDIRAVFEDETP